jgi:hypothetical protein
MQINSLPLITYKTVVLDFQNNIIKSKYTQKLKSRPSKLVERRRIMCHKAIILSIDILC